MKNKLKKIIILSGLTTVAMHFINRINYSLYTIKDYQKYTENKYYEWRFGKIRYITKGNGYPLLLLHDLNIGSSLYEFNKIFDFLSINHKVYAIDLLGYGMSDKPFITYTNYLYVQLIIDFIKSVIGKNTDIIATGDSTQIAVMACHNDPETVNKMIFINPQNLYETNKIPSKQTKILRLLIETPVIGTFLYNILTTKTSIENTFRKDYFYKPINLNEDDILSYVETAHLPDYIYKVINYCQYLPFFLKYV